jgi:hypothetical protein
VPSRPPCRRRTDVLVPRCSSRTRASHRAFVCVERFVPRWFLLHAPVFPVLRVNMFHPCVVVCDCVSWCAAVCHGVSRCVVCRGAVLAAGGVVAAPAEAAAAEAAAASYAMKAGFNKRTGAYKGALAFIAPPLLVYLRVCVSACLRASRIHACLRVSRSSPISRCLPCGVAACGQTPRDTQSCRGCPRQRSRPRTASGARHP